MNKVFLKTNSFDALRAKPGDVLRCTSSTIASRVGKVFILQSRKKCWHPDAMDPTKMQMQPGYVLSHWSVYGDKFEIVQP